MKTKKYDCLSMISTKNIAGIILALSFNTSIYCQKQNALKKDKANNEPRITITDFSYHKIVESDEQHSNYVISYRIKKNIFFEWQGQYDKDIFHNVFRMPLIIRTRIKDKFYSFAGAKLELGGNTIEKDEDDIELIQFKMQGGFGYMIHENFSVDLKYGKNLNNTFDKIHNMPSILSINGKLKF